MIKNISFFIASFYCLLFSWNVFSADASKGIKRKLFPDAKVVRSVKKARLDVEDESSVSDKESEEENATREPPIVISPAKTGPHNSVYGIFCGKDDIYPIPDSNERIDFTQLMNQESNNNDKLFFALRETEIKILQWIKNDPNFKSKSIYAGQTRDTESRVKEHNNDCMKNSSNSSNTPCEKSKKVEWVNNATEMGFALRLSSLAYNIPKEHLSVVEVLVGELLQVRAKGTTTLGNRMAYNTLREYASSAKRKEKLDDINKLTGQKPTTQRRGNFVSSPNKPVKDGGLGIKANQDVVYIQFQHTPGDTSFIPTQEERIDFSKLISNKENPDDNEIDAALLSIEIKIRTWIKNKPEFYNNARYVGLAEKQTHRVRGHRKSLDNLKEGTPVEQYESGKNVAAIRDSWNQNLDIHMSKMVYKIPDEYLPVVEVLVGYLLDVRTKGNTLLGNTDAYDRVTQYFTTTERAAKLKELKLDNICEELRQKNICALLGV